MFNEQDNTDNCRFDQREYQRQVETFKHNGMTPYEAHKLAFDNERNALLNDLIVQLSGRGRTKN